MTELILNSNEHKVNVNKDMNSNHPLDLIIHLYH